MLKKQSWPLDSSSTINMLLLHTMLLVFQQNQRCKNSQYLQANQMKLDLTSFEMDFSLEEKKIHFICYIAFILNNNYY